MTDAVERGETRGEQPRHQEEGEGEEEEEEILEPVLPSVMCFIQLMLTGPDWCGTRFRAPLWASSPKRRQPAPARAKPVWYATTAAGIGHELHGAALTAAADSDAATDAADVVQQQQQQQQFELVPTRGVRRRST